MYDKHGIVLRIETTINGVSFFKHHRKVEHRRGPASREGDQAANAVGVRVELGGSSATAAADGLPIGPPFSAGGASVRLGRGAVEAVRPDFIMADQISQNRSPDPRLGPSIEAIVDGRRGAILRRAVAPPTAGLHNMDDAADDLAVSRRFHSGSVHRDVGGDHRVLLVVQPERVRHLGGSHSVEP
jgi:hypothetical protein